MEQHLGCTAYSFPIPYLNAEVVVRDIAVMSSRKHAPRLAPALVALFVFVLFWGWHLYNGSVKSDETHSLCGRTVLQHGA